jgi:hypothetical protein
MNSVVFEEKKQLEACGYQIEAIDNIAKNSGEEGLRHRISKMSTAHVLWNAGYHVASEVKKDGRYADILAFGHGSRMPIVVELETNATAEDRKLYRELYGSPVVREVFTINVSELSAIPEYQVERIKAELGL